MALNVHGAPRSLLGSGDPPPVIITNATGSSPFLLIGDHAGNVIPAALHNLGLPSQERTRHIAWDIGVAGLGEAMTKRLDATFVRQVYSRLVVDCNRPADANDVIASVSDGSPIPGNQAIDAGARAARFAEIHEPYHQAIAQALQVRRAGDGPVVLVALHSFTPALSNGPARPWQVGILYEGGRTDFAKAVLSHLRRDPELTVGDNEPYAMSGIDYTVPRHAYADAISYVEIEVRQDLIATADEQRAWADRLAAVLTAARQVT